VSNATAKIAGRAGGVSDARPAAPDGAGGRGRWLILAVVGLAQLMVVLDATVMNIALPSAQRALHFSNADRQWVITAYALAFGSLLLLGGRLADLLGRKTTFLAGLAGFAAASAAGGAATGFGMLVAARTCQGAFGALARVGGLLTEYLSWRFSLYVNLVFAALAGAGAAAPAGTAPAPARPARRAGRGRRDVLHRLRLLQRREPQLAPVHLGVPRRGRRPAGRVRLVGEPRTAAAAAAAGCTGP
jgi:MFS family permease